MINFIYLYTLINVLADVAIKLRALAAVKAAFRCDFAVSRFGFQLATCQRHFYRSPRAILVVVRRGRVTLVHHRERSFEHSRELQLLQAIAQRNDWVLREDRRVHSMPVQVERRKSVTVAKVLVLSCSLFSFASAAEQALARATSAVSEATLVQAFNLFRPAPHAIFQPELTAQLHVMQEMRLESTRQAFEYDADDYQRVVKILQKKWLKTKADPASLAADMDQLARYIASQPAAFELLVSLAKKPLHLQYKAGEFRSVIKGNALSVRSVRVYFDPRSAAQLLNSSHCELHVAHCVASPADALLHELLHAKAALVNTAEFIRSGAMHALRYPQAHEDDVISQERALYAAMSAVDQLPRPQRKNHRGALVNSTCITCLDG